MRKLLPVLAALTLLACGRTPVEPQGCEATIYEPNYGASIPEFCASSDTL